MNADIWSDSNACMLWTECLAFIFIFRKSHFYDPLPINGTINRPKLCFILTSLFKVIEYILLRELITELRVYCGQDKFFE